MFLWQNGPTPTVSGLGTTTITLLFPAGAGTLPNKGALFVQVISTTPVHATTEGGDPSLDGLKFTVNLSGADIEGLAYVLLETALPLEGAP